MSGEAELPERLLTHAAWQMIVRRYALIAECACGKRLLDVGFGGGIGLRYLRRNGVDEIIAVDEAVENLAVARRLAGDVADIRRMDAHVLDFPDASFDVVSCMQVIQYLDAPRFVAEAARVLAPGGLLIVEMPNIRRRDGFKASAAGRSYHTATEMAALMAAAGFAPCVYGAFRIPAGATRASRQLLKHCKRLLVDAILIVPGGERVKDAIVSRLLPRVRVHEICEADVAALDESTVPCPLPNGDDGADFQLIYTVGTATTA